MVVKGSTRVINGERFVFLYYRHTKAEAKRDAERERKAGWKIRIIRNRIGGKIYYDLYGKRKKGRK